MKYEVVEGALTPEWIERIIDGWRQELRETGRAVAVISSGPVGGTFFLSPHPERDRAKAATICAALNESEAAD